MTLLVDVAEDPVFATATRAWTWSDVFLATRLWGEWDALLRATRDAHAAPEAVVQAGREWRMARRLIAGDELTAWLARRRLSLSDWDAHIRRAIGERSGTEAPDPRALWAEGACSGAWDDAAERLSARAAAWQAAGTPAASQPPPAEWSARTPAGDEALEIGVDPDRIRTRCAELWAAEEAFARMCAEVAASDAVATTVASHNVDWLRVECDWLEMAAEDAAREAVLLARLDGLALSDVAQRAGLPLESRSVYLADLDQALHPPLISSAPGDLVGPLALGNGSGRWLVAGVRAKLAPTLDDPDIRVRAEETAVAAAVARTIGEQVSWHEHD